MADNDITDLLIVDENEGRLAKFVTEFETTQKMDVDSTNDYDEASLMVTCNRYGTILASADHPTILNFINHSGRQNPDAKIVVYEIKPGCTQKGEYFETERAPHTDALVQLAKLNKIKYLKIGDPVVTDTVDPELVHVVKRPQITKEIKLLYKNMPNP